MASWHLGGFGPRTQKKVCLARGTWHLRVFGPRTRLGNVPKDGRTCPSPPYRGHTPIACSPMGMRVMRDMPPEASKTQNPLWACCGNVNSGLVTLKMRFSGTGRSRGVRRDLKRDELRLGILPPAPPARVRHGSAGEILLSGPNAAYTMLGRQRRTICSCEHTTNEPGCGRLTFRSCGGTRPARSPGMRWRGLVVLALGQMMGVTVK